MNVRRLIMLVGAVVLLAGVIGLLIPVSVPDGGGSNGGSIGCGNAIASNLQAARSANDKTGANIPIVGQLVPHTNLLNTGQVIEVCSHDVLGAGSGSPALIPAAPRGWLLDGLRLGSAPLAGSG